jgi:hypothetical protein
MQSLKGYVSVSVGTLSFKRGPRSVPNIALSVSPDDSVAREPRGAYMSIHAKGKIIFVSLGAVNSGDGGGPTRAFMLGYRSLSFHSEQEVPGTEGGLFEHSCWVTFVSLRAAT